MEATEIIITVCSVKCPHCGELNGGWLGDPTGESFICDYCGHEFLVSRNAEIKFQD